MEDNNVVTIEEIKKNLFKYFENKKTIKILNVGAKGDINKDFSWITELAKSEVFNLEYDLNFVENTEHSFFGDICSCPQIKNNSFDIVFIYNVLEHTKEPWEAAKECLRICKKNGVIISGAPFSWYYHQHPIDFWRFTHEGLKYLFERSGSVETINSGFKDVCWAVKKQQPKAKGLQSIYICKKK